MFALPSFTVAWLAVKRWALPALLAVLAAGLVWFAWQARELGSEVDTLKVKVEAETKEKTKALAREAEAVRLRKVADAASAASAEKTLALEAAVERQKGTIDALESKYGASRVSDLTAAHLGWLRNHQRR